MENIDPLRVLLSLVLVLGLIGLMALVLRRLAASGKFAGGGMVSPGQGRLAVVETRYLDTRRKLVLIRRDGTEHLLLLTPDSAQLLESGIEPPHA